MPQKCLIWFPHKVSFIPGILAYTHRGVEPLYPNRSRRWLYKVVSHGKPLREKKKRRKLEDPLIMLFFLVFSKCRRNEVWVKWRPCYFLVVWSGYKNIYYILSAWNLKELNNLILHSEIKKTGNYHNFLQTIFESFSLNVCICDELKKKTNKHIYAFFLLQCHAYGTFHQQISFNVECLFSLITKNKIDTDVQKMYINKARIYWKRRCHLELESSFGATVCKVCPYTHLTIPKLSCQSRWYAEF